MTTNEGDKNPKLTEFETAFTIELERLKRRAKLITVIGVGVLVIFAYRAHQENLMWRQEITDLLRNTPHIPRY